MTESGSAKRLIKDLKKGEEVSSLFSVKYKHPPESYANGFRFTVGLADKSGEIELKYWGGQDEEAVRKTYDAFRECDIVNVSGKMSAFRDRLEIHVNEGLGSIEKFSDYNIEDFIPKSKRDIEEMTNELKKLADAISNPDLKKLLETFLSDREFLESFKKAPSAMYMHHAYMGGLLEHTLNVVRICRTVARIYPRIDRDLMICGAILHDIGKIREFEMTTNIRQSEEGMLRGHIVIGQEMLLEKIKQAGGLPETLKMKLSHIMLSHHGNNEYGSPVEPAFPEAIVVYYADECDSKVDQFVEIKENVKTEDFRTYSHKLRRGIYLK